MQISLDRCYFRCFACGYEFEKPMRTSGMDVSPIICERKECGRPAVRIIRPRPNPPADAARAGA